ncbi:MAG: hypothetical protein KAV87_16925 [Desulfobacteraceae bacterium]|nr:hypothetical protein [Desulfobacteraceae bacterium]
MFKEISKHPSDIAESAVEYLKSVEVSEKTKRLYIDALYLFLESLLSDPSAVIENDDGEYLLSHNWEDYYGGAISNFIDWWLPRKLIGSDTLQARAPGILRKWIKWCYQHNYFDEEHYEDFIDSLPRGKSKEVKCLQKAGDLLYLLHTPDPGAWMTGDEDRIVSIDHHKEPEEWDEGYMKIVRFEKYFVYLENEEGTERGPVMLSKELVNVLKVGYVLNVSIGRFGKYWKVLESGNVYAEDTIL